MSHPPIAVVGECVADAFTDPPAAPPAGPEPSGAAAPAGSGIEQLGLRVLPGGGPANTAVALARLGTPARFLGRLSGDVFGGLFRRRLAASGVDLSAAVAAPEPSTLAVADLSDDGQAAYAFHASGTADFQWTAPELDPAALDGAACLHTGSLALALEPGAAAIEGLLEAARGRVTVSIDPNVRPGLVDPAEYRKRLPRWCRLADVLRLSDEDLAELMPGEPVEAACDAWHAAGVELVVVTHGGEGATASLRGERTRVAAPRVEVVDTVGAGDAFTAGLLHHLAGAGRLGGRLDALTGQELAEALAFSVRVAAATCARWGADPPRADKVDAAAAAYRG